MERILPSIKLKTNIKLISKTKTIKNQKILKEKFNYCQKNIKFNKNIEGEFLTAVDELIEEKCEDYIICICKYCEKLLFPFWIEKKFAENTFNIKKNISDSHFEYLKKIQNMKGIKKTENGKFINCFVWQQTIFSKLNNSI